MEDKLTHLKQKLPEAKPISDILKQKYLAYMRPIKIKLDSMESNLNFEEKTLITIP